MNARIRRALTAALAVSLAAACGSSDPSTPPNAPSPVGAASQATAAVPQLSSRELEEAIRFRKTFGLRADVFWIRQIAADPESRGRAEFGVLLTPDEFADMMRRNSIGLDAIKRMVADYGRAHPEDWAELFTDQQRGGILVAQFSANVDEHREALLGRLGPDAPLEIREVEWSYAELRAKADTVRGTEDWFLTIPAVLTGWGVDVTTNRISIKISSVNDDATKLIEEHFGWEGLVEVQSDGTGRFLVPRGTLRVLVRDAGGRPVRGVQCEVQTDLGTGSEGLGPVTDRQGVCLLDLEATGVWIHVQRGSGPTRETLASGRAVVVPGETSEVVIDLP
jgi:hypothetical protein